MNKQYAYCPRCGSKSLEHQKSYAHCAGCNYSPTLDGHLPAYYATTKEEGDTYNERSLAADELDPALCEVREVNFDQLVSRYRKNSRGSNT